MLPADSKSNGIIVVVAVTVIVIIICGGIFNFISSCVVCGTAHYFFTQPWATAVHFKSYFPSVCYNILLFPSW